MTDDRWTMPIEWCDVCDADAASREGWNEIPDEPCGCEARETRNISLVPVVPAARLAAAEADAERLAKMLRQFVPRQVGNTFYAESPNMACARAVLAEHRKRQEGKEA